MMKSKDIFTLALIVIVATVFSSLLAGKIFSGGSKHHNLKAPVIQPIDRTFPDIKNDSSYNSIFNSQALNPSQLIQIGNEQNSSTFSSQ
jgi:hypothetical protein